MTDPSRYHDAEPQTTRRWLRVLVIVAVIVVVLVVVVMLVGGGEHGPARHATAVPVVPPRMAVS